VVVAEVFLSYVSHTETVLISNNYYIIKNFKTKDIVQVGELK